MESTVIVSDRLPVAIAEVVKLLEDQGMVLTYKDWNQLYKEEGEVVFESSSKEPFYRIHIGSKAYYLEFDLHWESFTQIENQEQRLQAYSIVLKTMDDLGYHNQILMMSDTRCSVYDTIPDGWALEDILNIRSEDLPCMISKVGPLGLVVDDINVYDMNSPELLL